MGLSTTPLPIRDKLKTAQTFQTKWTSRFVWAAIIEGVLAVGWTLFIVNPFAHPSPSMVIASGSAGTWLLTGYALFLAVGVVAVAVTGMFYFFIEGILGKVYSGVSGVLAWLHLALMTVGVTGATFLLMYGGYVGGAALLPSAEGGGGLNPGQVHVQILQYYVNPTFYFIVIAVVGVILGGLGYIITSRKK
jgi:hypothetical protein